MASAMYYLDLGIFGITASQGKRDGISTVFLAGSISTTCYESLTVYAVERDGGVI
jgi:hypothetical protein